LEHAADVHIAFPDTNNQASQHKNSLPAVRLSAKPVVPIKHNTCKLWMTTTSAFKQLDAGANWCMHLPRFHSWQA
jgi:hypothetical protein